MGVLKSENSKSSKVLVYGFASDLPTYLPIGCNGGDGGVWGLGFGGGGVESGRRGWGFWMDGVFGIGD